MPITVDLSSDSDLHSVRVTLYDSEGLLPESMGKAMLSFCDAHGCARMHMHWVPVAVAHATARAFNDAMEAEARGALQAAE